MKLEENEPKEETLRKFSPDRSLNVSQFFTLQEEVRSLNNSSIFLTLCRQLHLFNYG
jgi:hypothetical protein